jgi:hypothetical protein
VQAFLAALEGDVEAVESFVAFANVSPSLLSGPQRRSLLHGLLLSPRWDGIRAGEDEAVLSAVASLLQLGVPKDVLDLTGASALSIALGRGMGGVAELLRGRGTVAEKGGGGDDGRWATGVAEGDEWEEEEVTAFDRVFMGLDGEDGAEA